MQQLCPPIPSVTDREVNEHKVEVGIAHSSFLQKLHHRKRLFYVWDFVFQCAPSLRQVLVHVAVFPVARTQRLGCAHIQRNR